MAPDDEVAMRYVDRKCNLMHILLVGLHRFTQPSGLCRYTANLFASLKTVESLRVSLVLGQWQKEYYERALKLDVDDPDIIWVALEQPAVSRYCWYLHGVPKLARKLNVSVVHAAFPMPFVKRWFACPIVTTMHDLYAYDAPGSIGFPNVWLNKAVLQQSIRSSDAIISISQFARDSLCKWFPRLKERMPLPVIYQEVRRRTSEAADSIWPNRGPDDKFLLCVAQHRKNKNLDLIIQAYYKAIDAGVIDAMTHLVIVGSEGAETRHLKSSVKQRTGVRFLSAIPDEQLAGLYKNCEALICASSIEGFCLPVAEALSFSSRVVCSDIPILREVAGEQGTYFALEPRSTDALVEAIRESLKSSRHTRLRPALLQPNSGEEAVCVYRYALKEAS
jgi:glycosyltransferase involved in cell wall biosynthesis